MDFLFNISPISWTIVNFRSPVNKELIGLNVVTTLATKNFLGKFLSHFFVAPIPDSFHIGFNSIDGVHWFRHLQIPTPSGNQEDYSPAGFFLNRKLSKFASKIRLATVVSFLRSNSEQVLNEANRSPESWKSDTKPPTKNNVVKFESPKPDKE